MLGAASFFLPEYYAALSGFFHPQDYYLKVSFSSDFTKSMNVFFHQTYLFCTAVDVSIVMGYGSFEEGV